MTGDRSFELARHVVAFGLAVVLLGASTTRAQTTTTPAATSVAAGSIRVTAIADVHGTEGEDLNAGEFQILNTTGTTESVSAIRVELSEAAVFSNVTLTASGQSVSVGSPSAENNFFFDPPLEIFPGSLISVALTVTIASVETTGTPSATPVATPTAAATATATATPDLGFTALTRRGPGTPPSPPMASDGTSRTRDSLAIGVAMTGLLMTLLSAGGQRRRRSFTGLALVVLGTALYSGCGSEQSSEQTVTDLTVTIPTGPVTVTGLPASLGMVSRPLPLVFPGASSTPNQ